MEREILFKRYHFDFDGKCYHTSYWGYIDSGFCCPASLSVEDKARAINCQFTGQLDTTGKKIFEGDICSDEFGSVLACVWVLMESCFALDDNGIIFYFGDDSKWTVIGNIYDNPALLILNDE